jgi:hypothetical protein
LKPVNLQPQSFIIKIWCESDSDEGGKVVWRGHITHVPSGDRIYISSLEEITGFLNPFIEKMGCSS